MLKELFNLTISVEVVEDRHAGLLLPSLLRLLPVVRLRPPSSPSARPVVELVTIGWRHLHLVG